MWTFQFDHAASQFYSDWQTIVSNYFKKQEANKSIDLFDYHATPSYKKPIFIRVVLGTILVKKWKKIDILKEIWSADPLHI